MSLEWKRIKPLKNKNAVQEFLQKYNCTLSKELKECITVNNGGRPYPDVISLDNGDEFDVKSLLSFNKTDRENIYKVIDYFMKQYHGEIVPFASDSAGNYYCEKDEKVVLWMQDGEMILVADSFVEFLNSLHKL